MGNNIDEFVGKKLRFEDSNATDAGRRYVDITVTETNGRKTFYEFKSVKDVPPPHFLEQFLKDLKNKDVTSLDQIKWVFNEKKKPDNFRVNMEKEIKKLELDKDLAEKLIGRRNVNCSLPVFRTPLNSINNFYYKLG